MGLRGIGLGILEALNTEADHRLSIGSGSDDPNLWFNAAIGKITHFKFDLELIPLMVFSALSLLNLKELGKGFVVLVTISKGLRRNDVVNRGNVDRETFASNDHRTRQQFVVRHRSPFKILQFSQYVERSRVGRPRRVHRRLEHDAVDLNRQCLRFRVAHARDAQSCVEFTKS
jgi:hypothetical protein